MMGTEWDAETNPYAPSEIPAAPLPEIKDEQELRVIIRRFKSESTALAGFWMVVGAVLVLVGYFGMQNLPSTFQEFVTWEGVFNVSCFCMGMTGLAWGLTGILTLLRVERAIRIGLVINYVVLLFPPVWMTLFGLLLLPLGIAQAHRVLGCIEDIRNAEQARAGVSGERS